MDILLANIPKLQYLNIWTNLNISVYGFARNANDKLSNVSWLVRKLAYVKYLAIRPDKK